MDRVDIISKKGTSIQVKSTKKQSNKRPLGEPIKYEKVPKNESQNACKQMWAGRFFPKPQWVGRQSKTDPTAEIGRLANALAVDKTVLRSMVEQVRREHPKDNEKMTGEVHNCRVSELYHVLKRLGYNEARAVAMCAQLDPYFGESDAYHLEKYREERDAVRQACEAELAAQGHGVAAVVSPIVSAESSAHDSSSSDERKRRRVSDESAVEVANSNVAPATPATPVSVVSNPAPAPLVSDGPVPTPEQMAKLAADFASVYARFQAFQNGQ